MSKTGINPVLSRMLGQWQAEPDSALQNVQYASDPDANRLIQEDDFAFLMAACIDRMGKSTAIWNLPYHLKTRWRSLDPATIKEMNAAELASLPEIEHMPGQVGRLDIAKTIIGLAGVVAERGTDWFFGGSVQDSMYRLQQIHGVGPNIARMIIIQRLLYYGFAPAGGILLPKIDVHVSRVFVRTGLVRECSEREVEKALARLSMREVAIVDQVTWGLGQRYCHQTLPDCSRCPLGGLCPRTGV